MCVVCCIVLVYMYMYTICCIMYMYMYTVCYIMYMYSVLYSGCYLSLLPLL